jgi:hypothetical protein
MPLLPLREKVASACRAPDEGYPRLRGSAARGRPVVAATNRCYSHRRSMWRGFMGRRIARICSLLLLGLCLPGTSGSTAEHPVHGQIRQYYIAADEIDWDYMPSGRDAMMPNMPPAGYAKFYAQRGPHLIGKLYRKVVYREYTDATFHHLKARPPEEAYLGILGPVLRAEVGDSIRILFRNNGTHPYSMHPHGVFYDKSSEGAP